MSFPFARQTYLWYLPRFIKEHELGAFSLEYAPQFDAALPWRVMLNNRATAFTGRTPWDALNLAAGFLETGENAVTDAKITRDEARANWLSQFGRSRSDGR